VYRLAQDYVALIRENIQRDGDAAVLALEPEVTQEALTAVRNEINRLSSRSAKPVILVDDWKIRPFVRALIEPEFPQVRVVAEREVAAVDPRFLSPVSVITMT
jgi:flagellar biosynthesis component FlhA